MRASDHRVNERSGGYREVLGRGRVHPAGVAVAISYAGGTPFIFDSATGTFTAGPAYRLTVKLPACGTDGEIDLVLGPPSLYPASADLGAFYFKQPPCSTGPER